MNPPTIPDLIDREQLPWSLLQKGWASPNDAQHEQAMQFADALNARHRERMAEVIKERDEALEYAKDLTNKYLEASGFLQRQLAESREENARLREALEKTADLAHSGGLACITQEAAMNYIRRLTLVWFKTKRSRDDHRQDVKNIQRSLTP